MSISAIRKADGEIRCWYVRVKRNGVRRTKAFSVGKRDPDIVRIEAHAYDRKLQESLGPKKRSPAKTGRFIIVENRHIMIRYRNQKGRWTCVKRTIPTHGLCRAMQLARIAAEKVHSP